MLKQLVQTVADYLPGESQHTKGNNETNLESSTDSTAPVNAPGNTESGQGSSTGTGGNEGTNGENKTISQLEALSSAPGLAGDQLIGKGQETGPGAVADPLDEPPEKPNQEVTDKKKEPEGDPKYHPGPLWGTPGTIPDMPPKKLLNHGVEILHP